MKNLKKLSRENLKIISGGGVQACRQDSDCGAYGCAFCKMFNNHSICMYKNDLACFPEIQEV
jgi:hypothetical protein